ncbi:MAG: MSEP-CTERM sorting domain-containing protein [Gammaproteobacteria bacterium]|nr:MSEP-CTERM sorting domain-containing protein [Gammaproteobacteria bacterium]
MIEQGKKYLMESTVQSSKSTVLQSLLWLIFVPQCLLLFLNFRSWHLISGEVAQQQINAALVLLIYEVLIIVGTVIFYWFFRQGRLSVGARIGLIGIIAQAGYMILFLNTIDDVIPGTIQPWIVSEGNIARWNITLMMPGAFMALYVFTKALFAGMGKTKSRALTFGLTIGVPLIWYLITTLMQPVWFNQVSVIGWIIISAACVTIFLAAIINAFDNLLHRDFSTHMVEKHYIAAVLLGLAAPFAGLYLNRSIPFPVDFQATSVYVLTLLNGLILLLKPGNTRYLAAKYFLRCLSLPFIIYFFLVFLPFLPLSLLAIIAVGMGFLMLTPLILGLFQFRVTLREFHLLSSEQGKIKTIVITIVGLMVLPGYFVAEATLDRAALNKTLDYFYAHDFAGEPLSTSDIHRAAKTLVQLRDRKSDIQMPYISGFYNAIVFGDMVLPDTKIAQTYQWLTNKSLPHFNVDFMAPDRKFRRFNGTSIAPKSDVDIEHIKQFSTKDPAGRTVRLTLKNKSADTNTLYQESLVIPEGIFITGMRLKIGDEWVNGQIFDKKTALWVFQKITEVRQDPAILYYTSPTTLQLRVYPFPANGIREVEFDLLYHPGINANLTIGNTVVDLNKNTNKHVIVSTNGKDVIDTSAFAWRRTPYLHVILDFSAGEKRSSASYSNEIRSVGQKLGIHQARITAANISTAQDNPDHLVNLSSQDDMIKVIENIKLPQVSGFWLDRAVANEMQRIKFQLDENNLNLTPVFLVILNKETKSDAPLDIQKWHRLIPDSGLLYVSQNEILKSYSLETGNPVAAEIIDKPASIVAIRKNDQIHILPSDTASIVDFISTDTLSIYNSRKKHFEPVTTLKSLDVRNEKWANFATVWSKWISVNLQPSLFEDQRNTFLAASRDKGLLLPSTALIVVESDSQWKILERKEDQSSGNHSALEFEEERKTSEPAWWILIIFIFIYIFNKDKRPGSA